MSIFIFHFLVLSAALVCTFKSLVCGEQIESIKFTAGSTTSSLKFSNNHSQLTPRRIRIDLNKSKLLLTNRFFQHVTKGRSQEAIDTLQALISLEKVNRMKTCLEAFGQDNCSNQRHVDPRPFYIWKRKFVHELFQDPTKAVIRQLRQMAKTFLKVD